MIVQKIFILEQSLTPNNEQSGHHRHQNHKNSHLRNSRHNGVDNQWKTGKFVLL